MVSRLIILLLTQTFTDLLMTKRLQTLQSVDVAMERIVQALADTFIFYTSDHGESREERTSLTSHHILSSQDIISDSLVFSKGRLSRMISTPTFPSSCGVPGSEPTASGTNPSSTLTWRQPSSTSPG